MSVAPTAQLDHLVVAGTTLAQAIEYVADLTGIAARVGGQHTAMGTHNALVKLGEKVYLELIAIDPSQPKPNRPRWFDMDDAKLALTLGERPRLIHWVARTKDLEGMLDRVKHEAGAVHAMSRGAFKWRMTIPDDGRSPGDGIVPTLIQWDVDKHPVDGLPNDHAALVEFAASHPEPETIRRDLAAMGLGDTLRVTYDSAPRLAAMIRTPRGLVTL